jgi:PAS domain S-box-containing protein
LAAIVDSSTDAIISKTLEGTITSWNAGAQHMFGHTAAEAIGRPNAMIIPQDRLDEEHSIMERISRGEQVEHSETVRIAKNGRLVDVSVTVSPVRDTSGRIIGASSVTRDITRRKRVENALRESESRFQAVTKNAPAAIFIKDRDGRYTVANPLACEALGRPEDAVGYTDHDLLPAEIADALRKTDLEVMTSGTPVKREEVVRRPGFDQTYLSVKFPLARNGGQVEGVCGVSIEITDRKRAEQARLESEERFRMLADNIAQLAWMADETGYIFWYNQRWFDYTGTALDEMQGWGWQAVHAPEHVDRVVKNYARCIALGEVWEDTFPLRGADGEYRWFLSRAIPIRGADGCVLRWFGTNTDITAQRDAEEALRLADRRKDEFLAMLAH